MTRQKSTKKQRLLQVTFATIAAFTFSISKANELPDPFTTQKIVTDKVIIAGGMFTMGSNETQKDNNTSEFTLSKPWFLDEHPERRINLPTFSIDKFEVSNAQYRLFVLSTSAKLPPSWMTDGYLLALQQEGIEHESLDTLRRLGDEIFRFDANVNILNKTQLIELILQRLDYLGRLPVMTVTWHEATEYCKWNQQRLPTEQEWERVARGQNGRQFPWGDEWRANIGNTGEAEEYEKAAPVGTFEKDVTPEGVHDIAGNVSEWVDDWYQGYPKSPHQSKDYGKTYKVVRGSSWSDGSTHYNLAHFQRGAYRFNLEPAGRYDDVGFRCASSTTSSH